MTNHKYFLDANILINILNKGTKSSEEEARREKNFQNLRPILNNPNSKFFVSSLVHLEVLRGILEENQYNIAKNLLNNFTMLGDKEIRAIIEETIMFSRFCKQQGMTKKIGVMDYLHFITAKHYDLQILSFDNHVEKLEAQYRDYLN